MRRIGLLAALAARRGGGPLRDRLLQRLGAAAPEDGSEDEDSVVAVSVGLPPGATLESDVAYGDDAAQRLDVYRPGGAGAAPIVVFVHGGGWRRGDKAMRRIIEHKMPHWLGLGCIFVSINYRMLPDADPLRQAEDVARALAFVQRNGAQWGGDPARVALVGHSAGAHLAALISADPALAIGQGASPWSATVILDTAALDLVAIMTRPHYRFYDPVFGSDTRYWREVSPTHRLDGEAAAPMLLVCSSLRDDSLPPAREFAARAAALGGRVEVLAVELSHLQINEELGTENDYTAAVDRFLHSVGIP